MVDILNYTAYLNHDIIYSIGDTHGRGREIIDFIHKIQGSARDSDKSAAFVQLGDLCDGFSLPEDSSNDALRADIQNRMFEIPALGLAINSGRQIINWHKHSEDRDGDIIGITTAADLLNSSDHSEIVALYEACKCYETLWLYSKEQQTHPNEFYIIIGNHDADLLRGRCQYGRQQKHILLGLLGFSADEVVNHMTHGTPQNILNNHFLSWLSERPHLGISHDAIYMHGGPTAALCDRFNASAESKTETQDFQAWLKEIDAARNEGWDHPLFEEHHCFLSPDGAENDWIKRPDRISTFLNAAKTHYLVVGHSPFLDFEKGVMLDLKDSPYQKLFATPGRLQPEGRLIKHDTDLKRNGELWAVRHPTYANEWLGIQADHPDLLQALRLGDGVELPSIICEDTGRRK